MRREEKRLLVFIDCRHRSGGGIKYAAVFHITFTLQILVGKRGNLQPPQRASERRASCTDGFLNVRRYVMQFAELQLLSRPRYGRTSKFRTFE